MWRPPNVVESAARRILSRLIDGLKSHVERVEPHGRLNPLDDNSQCVQLIVGNASRFGLG